MKFVARPQQQQIIDLIYRQGVQADHSLRLRFHGRRG
jgi:hypothetical protein